MNTDIQRYIKTVEDFPITSLEEREAMQFAIKCMQNYVTQKKMADMITEANAVDAIKHIQGSNDVRMKTATEVKDEMLAIMHKYCG